MKSKSVGLLFLVLTLVAGVMAFTPVAFAESKVEVKMAQGSSTTGCEQTKSCFQSAEVTLDVGGEVTWTNGDTAAHTVTSGEPSGPPEQVGAKFDSSLIPASKTFSHTFTDAGTYKYFCIVHPWMTGVVTVQAVAGQMPSPGGEKMENAMYVKGMSSDSSVHVDIETVTPEAGKALTLKIEFTDASGTKLQHVNYAIVATQDGTQVLSKSDGHTHIGEDTLTTDALSSAGAVDIQVTLNGQGLPDTDPSTWTGPKGDIVKLQVVPEFGAIATVVLAIAVVSIIAVTAKTRVIPKL